MPIPIDRVSDAQSGDTRSTEVELSEQHVPTTEVTFEVRYPWGSSYVEQMRAALEALGMVTADNPLAEGGDIESLLFSDSLVSLTAGLALVSVAVDGYSDLDDDDYWTWLTDLYERLGELGVQRIEQDWKYCTWEDDFSFEHVGLERTLVSASGPDEPDVFVFRLGFPQPDEP